MRITERTPMVALVANSSGDYGEGLAALQWPAADLGEASSFAPHACRRRSLQNSVNSCPWFFVLAFDDCSSSAPTDRTSQQPVPAEPAEQGTGSGGGCVPLLASVGPPVLADSEHALGSKRRVRGGSRRSRVGTISGAATRSSRTAARSPKGPRTRSLPTCLVSFMRRLPNSMPEAPPETARSGGAADCSKASGIGQRVLVELFAKVLAEGEHLGPPQPPETLTMRRMVRWAADPDYPPSTRCVRVVRVCP